MVKIKQDMPVDGKPEELVFNGMRCFYDESGNLKFMIVSLGDYDDELMNFNKDIDKNYELFNLCKQLGVTEFDEKDPSIAINKFVGKKVLASKVTRGTFENVHFGKAYEPKKATAIK